MRLPLFSASRSMQHGGSGLPVHRPPQPYSRNSLEKTSRLQGAVKVDSVCPYCAVGCSTNIYLKDGQVIDIEGNPQSPINEGTLCPKGANIYQLEKNPHKIKHAMYRAPYSSKWQQVSLDWAMDQIAERLKKTRDEGYLEKSPQNGEYFNAVRNIGMLGGATLDNEENYLMKKLFGGGLQILSIENQARI